MENGGSNGGLTNHVPWYWDTQATSVYKYFATLHTELAPYNFSGVVDSHLQGGSLMKSCDKSNFAHKLSNDIFVGLITSDVTSRNITFPGSDKWIDYWNENAASGIYAGGTTKSGYSASIDKFPIFLRTGAIIPMDVKTDVTSHGDPTSVGKTTVLFYPYALALRPSLRNTGECEEHEKQNTPLQGTGECAVAHRTGNRDSPCLWLQQGNDLGGPTSEHGCCGSGGVFRVQG